MSNSDDLTDKDFVWRDNYNRHIANKEDKIDSYENNMYETGDIVHRKEFSKYLKIAAVVFFIFIILFIVLIFKPQNSAEKNQVLAIEKRLNRLEAEFTALKTYIASKLDQAIKEMERQKHTTATQKAPSAKTLPPAQKEQKNLKPKVHKVQSGESLSRISRYYGLSIDQLRNYNGLEANAIIYPGQELKLTP